MISACRVQCLPVVLPQCGKTYTARSALQRLRSCLCHADLSGVCIFRFFVPLLCCFQAAASPRAPCALAYNSPCVIFSALNDGRAATRCGVASPGSNTPFIFCGLYKKHFARCASSCLLLGRLCCAACRRASVPGRLSGSRHIVIIISSSKVVLSFTSSKSTLSASR